ncbi:MAG TPA: c-type cytochrome domain-containing protein [Granulicella sp.]
MLAGMLGCEDTTTASHEATLTPELRQAHDDAATLDFYRSRVQPIFQQDCYRCHAGLNRKGEFRLKTRADLKKGGKHGAAVVPGDPDRSLLVQQLRQGSGVEHPMPPPPQQKMPDADRIVIERWVQAGAIMPDTPDGR